MSSLSFCFKRLALARKMFAAIFFLALSRSPYAQMPLSGNSSGTLTKASSPYVLTGNVTVPSGQTLTIEAGVIIKMPRRDYHFIINGVLIAQGTASDSIRFKGEFNPAVSGSSHGGTLYFSGGTQNSVLSYVSVDSLGDLSNGFPYNTALRLDAPCTIENSSLRNSEGTLVYANRSALNVSSNNFYLNNTSYEAIFLTDTIVPVITNNYFGGVSKSISTSPGSVGNVSSNTNATIELSGNVVQNSIWPKPGPSSHYKLSGVSVNTGKTLTIQPGCIIESQYSAGYLNVNGTLIANGTATDSIYFVGKFNTVSYKYGGNIVFDPSSLNSSMQYVSMDSMGYNGYAIQARSSLALSNSSIRNSGNYALQIERTSVYVSDCSFSSASLNYQSVFLTTDTISPTIQNCSFNGSIFARTIYGSPGAVTNVYNNSNAVIELSGSVTQNAIWQKPGSGSFYKATNVNVNNGKTLTLKPGCKVIMPFGNSFSINGTLVANGAAADSIYFIGQKQIGYGDYGGWFDFTSTSVNSSFSYVRMDSIGQANYSNYSVRVRGQLSINNSTFSNSGSYALHIERSNASVNNCLFYSNNTSYQSIYIASDTISPVIQNCSFTGSFSARTIYGNPGSISNLSNNTNAIVDLSGEVIQNSSWSQPGPNSYYKASGVSVGINKTLTIQPGCHVVLPFGSSFTVNGTLNANGTAADSIYFIGLKQTGYGEYGGWIDFASSSRNSSLSYVSLDSLGQAYYSNYAMRVRGAMSMSNSSLRNAGSYGLYIERSNIAVNNCSFGSANTSYQSIYIVVDTISPTIQNCMFSGGLYGRTIYANPGSISNLYNNTNAVIELTGDVVQNSSWSSPGTNSFYKISGVSVAANKKLTIQAGCKIIIPFNSSFSINGTLLANGTATDSISFVGQKQAGYGDYGGWIDFNSSSVGSSMSYVSMDSLGQPYYSNCSVRARSLSLSNSAIRNSGSYALQIERSNVVINNCSFSSKNNTYQSINLSSDTIAPTIQNCVFYGSAYARTISTSPSSVANISNNTNAFLELSGSVAQNTSWPKPGVNSYYKVIYVNINGGNTLTIDPGCKVLMPYGNAFSVNGTLIAEGAATDSIHFIGGKQGTSYSYGSYFNFLSSSKNSFLSYVSMDSLGYSNYPITAASSFTLTNSHIKNSGNYSIYFNSDTISPTIQNCVFGGNDASRTIYSNPGSISNITNNTNTIIYLSGSVNQNGQWLKQGLNSYYKIGSVSVENNKTLTINPGCKVIMPYGGVFNVYGTLTANGAASDSIYFIGGRQQTSYAYGGYFNILSSSGNSSFSYASFDSLGYGNYPITAARSFSLRNSFIKNSGNYSLYLNTDTIAPVIQNCVFGGSESSRTVYAPSTCFSLVANTTNIILRPNSTINANTVWPKQASNSYYQIDGTITINAANVLTIEQGNTVNFPYTSSYLSVNGTLRAQGTETAPVQFLKIAGTGSSSYGGGVFLNSGSSNNVLSYCTFDKLGGYTGYALGVFTTDASLSNLSISNSNSYGIYVQGASPTITSANITGSPYGVYSSSGKPVLNNCNIFGNTTYGIYNASGTISDTVDARNSYWGHPSGPNHPTLNASGQGNKVTDKVKFNQWKGQPANGQIVDLGVAFISKPITGCNLSSTDTVRVKITNFGNLTQAGFPVSYRINGGTPVTETVTVSLLPGTSLEYGFTQRANLGATGSYQISAYTAAVSDSAATNDTASVTIHHLSGVNAPANLLPANNSTNVNLPVALNWSAVPDAESYDLYVWKSSAPVPASPTIGGLTQISYSLSAGSLQYSTAYSWKVTAKRSDCRSESAVQNFTTRELPDLVVESISVPPAATSETDVSFSWKIKNISGGSTGNSAWYDLVYISNQPVLGTGTDIFINQYANFSALNAGESYQSATVTYRIPQGWQGPYYVIVKTNANYSKVIEVTDTNNLRTSTPINISLAPPPDLQVINVVANPLTIFSEDSITVSYTVQNAGTGPTSAPYWRDVVYLSKDTALITGAATFLFDVTRSQVLAANGSYTVTKKAKLPAQISGTYYVHVITDKDNNIFEYVREDNNTRKSLTLNIILRPAPNLIVSNLSVSGDSVSTNQPVSLQWTTRNEGAATAKPFWYEAIYYSLTATFNASTAISVGGISRRDSIPSLGTLAAQSTVHLPPDLAEGAYWFFVKTDAYNQVFEGSGENDNLSAAAGPLYVRKPDLRPVVLNTPATALSEQSIAISWTVENNSNAVLYNSYWTDGIYLSRDTLLDGGDVLLTSQTINQLLPAGTSYNRQATALLPQGLSGNYYFLLVSNAFHTVSERTETNNLLYKPVTITLAPWPDLQVTGIAVPSTGTVGAAVQVQYTVQNTSGGAVLNKVVTDYVYLSSTNDVNASGIFLGSASQNRTLNSNDFYTQTATLPIPASLPGGTYYIIVFTDATNQIYENTGENNNRRISTAITLINIPPVDLSVTAGQLLSGTLTAGQTANLQWTVKNNSAVGTVVSVWQDAVYLSNNPVLDAGDVLLSTFSINGPLAPGSSHTQTRSVSIPANASGTLYLLVNTDKNNVQNDPNRGNNTLSIGNGSSGQGIVVVVPPPADLVVQNVSAPVEATAAQPMTLSFVVKNNGQGSTPVPAWMDGVYLSTDYQFDNGDILIGSVSRNGLLAKDSQYTATLQATIPSQLYGNYVLIVKADGNNQVYEPNKANNVAFSPLFIASQLPSDLVVAAVTIPTGTQLSGAPLTVGWKLKNIGSNTAVGYLKEAIYLSADSVLDATDVLFGTAEEVISLPPQATMDRQLTRPLNGVGVGNYFVFVKTDVLNNILEQNKENNLGSSTTLLNVNVKELLVNVSTTDTLSNSRPLYYRIEVPATLEDETVSVMLTGDSARSAVNRLFIRYADVPTTNQYDIVADVAFAANQEALIPGVQAGTYYLMALGIATQGTIQPVSLLAKTVPFAVTRVDAIKGGNTGSMTLKVNGARFEISTRFFLQKGTDTIYPVQVYYINQTQAFATYNLLNAGLGYYNVVAQKLNGTATALPNGFEVVKGPGSSAGFGDGAGGSPGSGTGFVCQIINIGFEDQLQTDIFAPAGVRRNSVSVIDIQFENTGSVDIPVPVRYLFSLTNDVYIGFSPAEFPQHLKDLKLECHEASGPPGVLRPGAKGFFKIYISVPALRGIGTIDFMLSE